MNELPEDNETDLPVVPVDSLADAAPRHSEEWLEELAPLVRCNAISVEHEVDSYYTLIGTRYPIGFNRIDWRYVNNHKSIDVISSDERTWNQCRIALKGFESSIQKWIGKNLVSNDQELIVIGDGADIALRMKAQTFFECCDIVLVSGQHVYVLPPSGDWCLNYTMEDQLFFGLSRDAKAVGQLPYDDDIGG